MTGRRDKRVGKWTIKWTKKRTDRRTNERMNKRSKIWTNGWTNIWTNGRTNIWTNERTKEWTENSVYFFFKQAIFGICPLQRRVKEWMLVQKIMINTDKAWKCVTISCFDICNRDVCCATAQIVLTSGNPFSGCKVPNQGKHRYEAKNP